MEREKRITEEVEKTLNAFDDLPELESNPFLYTRIKSSMNDARTEKKSLLSVLKPAFFVILVLLNFYTIFGTGESSEPTKGDYLNAISSEYMLSGSSYYGYNINK